jgi:2-keto-4-pentenoate hydratase/2-oxohepta-3-ene-1,7-dioic acid hydratase in catechol pathway/regulator of RNase E activity RraA
MNGKTQIDRITATPIGSIKPGKIIAVHLNYLSRAAQRGRTPQYPSYFLKPSSSLSCSGTEIERPPGTELLVFEGEIALIVGRSTRHVTVQDGWAAISGVTAANDFGIYDLRYADRGSNLRSKGGDGFTPLGPALLPAGKLPEDGLRLRTWVNERLVQEDTSADLIFSFSQLVADLSQLITLEPGDVILTGTPAGSSVVQPGDIVEVEVDAPNLPGAPSTGRLVTPVVQGETAFTEIGALPAVDDAQRLEAWGSARAAGLPEPAQPFALTAEVRTKLCSVGTATLSSQLRKRGFNNLSINGVHSTKPTKRLVGRARTLRYIAYREDLFAEHGGGYNAQKRAFDTLAQDDVLVMEARGEKGAGTLGDILALRAQTLGAAGIVTDGGARDVAALTELQIPIYHAGGHPAVLGLKHVPWEVDVTISCGSAAVQPGDVIVGDVDGVLVIPPRLLDEVLNDAIEQECQERFIAEQVASGKSVEGLYPLTGEWKMRYEQWLKTR